MTWNDKVVWTEGMFLQPQHFQQHDRYLEWQLRSRAAACGPYCWGFSRLVLDNPSAATGCVAVNEASGILPDGTPFSLPDNDPPAAALDVRTDVRNELVVLAAVRQRPGLVDTDAEEVAVSAGPRYIVNDASVTDSNFSGSREAPVQIGRLNLRLMLQRDCGEAFVKIGVARIVERLPDNRLVLDPEYVPPLLHALAHPLLDSCLREVHALVNQRAEELAARVTPTRTGIGTFDDFVLLQALNRNVPLLAHLQRVSPLHPERLYCTFSTLASELGTFRVPRRPTAVPDYFHDDLARSFRPLMEELRRALSIFEPKALPIKLDRHENNFYVARLPSPELLSKSSFVLAVHSQLGQETVLDRVPKQIRVASTRQIQHVVTHLLPGVPLMALSVVPPEIPYHADFSYFRLETRHNEEWKQVLATGGMALHVGGSFPGMTLELWATGA